MPPNIDRRPGDREQWSRCKDIDKSYTTMTIKERNFTNSHETGRGRYFCYTNVYSIGLYYSRK